MREPPPMERWSRRLTLRISFEEFHRLPRNIDYRYEYFDGVAHIAPRPRTSDAFLPLDPPDDRPSRDAPTRSAIRPPIEADWDALPDLFAAAFAGVAPFANLGEKARLHAARHCLRWTRDGHDGPIVAPACFVAFDPEDGRIEGASIVTRPGARQMHHFADRRRELAPPPPEATVAAGWPHLTWIFVAPFSSGRGIGSAMLDASTRALRGLGERELASTFLHGNSSSLRWHWRNGFRILPNLGSMRRRR